MDYKNTGVGREWGGSRTEVGGSGDGSGSGVGRKWEDGSVARVGTEVGGRGRYIVAGSGTEVGGVGREFISARQISNSNSFKIT